MSRRYQVMLVPEDGGNVRSFVVARTWAKWGVVALALCLVSLAAGVVLFARSLEAERSLAEVQRENEGLLEHVDRVSARLDQVVDAVAKAEEKEMHARLLAGLDPVDSETRMLGVGGPLVTSSTAERMRTSELASEVENQARLLDELERRVVFQRRSYRETIELLESRKDRLDRTPTISPLRSMHALSSSYGWRDDPFTGERAFHYGVDLRAPAGTPVYSTASGVIAEVAEKPDYGLTVVIDHGGGLETRYAHLKSSDREVGEQVSRADVVGTIGSTGRSTGPHVHYEVRVNGVAQNPAKYIMVLPAPPED